MADNNGGGSAARQRLYDINRHAARFFFDNLMSEDGERGREYLKKRGLSSATVRHFGIGYAVDGWEALRDFLLSKGFSTDELISSGVCAEGKRGGCFDFFRDRVMFPVIDENGNVVAFSGRIIDGDGRKYLNTKDTAVFKKSGTLFALNFAKNTNSRQLVVVEGQMDVIALHSAGFDNAIASLGTALTEEHVNMVARYADTVVLAYDADEAGQKATRRAIELFRDTAVSVRVVRIVGAKDADEFVQTFGVDKFRELLNGAISSTEYELQGAREGCDFGTDEGRAKFLAAACKVLGRLASLDEALEWAERVADETGASKDYVMLAVDDTRKKTRRGDTATVASVLSKASVIGAGVTAITNSEKECTEMERDSLRDMLFEGADKGDMAMFARALDNGADINEVGKHEFSALMLAAIGGYDEIVAEAIRRGADVNARSEDGISALLLAVENDNVVGATALIEAGADVNVLPSPLVCAVGRDSWDMVRFLIDKGADVNMADKDGLSPLVVAARGGDEDVVRLLVEHGAEVDARDMDGVTPLVKACEFRRWGAVKTLLDLGADVNATNGDGRTALAATVEALIGEGEDAGLGALRVLIKRGADVEAKNGEFAGNMSALSIAARVDRLDIMNALVEAGADVNAVGIGGTALIAASREGAGDAMKWLLRHGAEVDVRDGRGSTALLVALMSGNSAGARVLLDAGANPNATNLDGYSPLSFAQSHGVSAPLLTELLARAGGVVAEQGADTPSAVDNSDIVFAVNAGDVDAVRQLIAADKTCVFATDGMGIGVLSTACYDGNVEIVKLLLDNGASVAERDDTERTPLHFAVEAENSDVIIPLLLDAGADVNAKDEDGNTPLLHAKAIGAAVAEGVLMTAPTVTKFMTSSAANGALPFKNTLVVNAFGGAGAGKTTSCFEIMEKLKKRGYVVEYAPEYAKELVWDNRLEMLKGTENGQRVLLAEQNRRIERLVGKCDFVVTDSPLILNLMYDKELTDEYTDEVLELVARYDNFNYVVMRDDTAFEQEGRIHTLEESKVIDRRINDFLDSHGIYYGTYSHKTVDKVVDNCVVTLDKLNRREARVDGAETTGTKRRLFVDMDGTLAKFTPVDEIETLYERGYFRNLAPLTAVTTAISNLAAFNSDVEVYVLSSYLTDSEFALDEKNAWLDRYLPDVNKAHRIFVPCGSKKADFVRGLCDTDFLLDDYTYNLNEWQPPARGIKLLNGINNTRGTWQYDRVAYNTTGEALAQQLTDIICGGKSIRAEASRCVSPDVIKNIQTSVRHDLDSDGKVSDNTLKYIADNGGKYEDGNIVSFGEPPVRYAADTIMGGDISAPLVGRIDLPHETLLYSDLEAFRGMYVEALEYYCLGTGGSKATTYTEEAEQLTYKENADFYGYCFEEAIDEDDMEERDYNNDMEK